MIGTNATSGRDSVPKLFDIGKATIVKDLQQNILLTSVGNLSSTKEEIFNESSNVIAACDGVENQPDLSKMRYTVWLRKAEGKLTSTPNLSVLAPNE